MLGSTAALSRRGLVEDAHHPAEPPLTGTVWTSYPTRAGKLVVELLKESGQFVRSPIIDEWLREQKPRRKAA